MIHKMVMMEASTNSKIIDCSLPLAACWLWTKILVQHGYLGMAWLVFLVLVEKINQPYSLFYYY